MASRKQTDADKRRNAAERARAPLNAIHKLREKHRELWGIPGFANEIGLAEVYLDRAIERVEAWAAETNAATGETENAPAVTRERDGHCDRP